MIQQFCAEDRVSPSHLESCAWGILCALQVLFDMFSTVVTSLMATWAFSIMELDTYRFGEVYAFFTGSVKATHVIIVHGKNKWSR